MRVKDKVSGLLTEAYQFDGTDEGGSLRAKLSASPSVPQGAEVVVGSFRMYLPQEVNLPNGLVEVETEIVLRYEHLIWDEDVDRWVIYPPKLYDKYFEEVPDGEA
jgi:hypothetical protein